MDCRSGAGTDQCRIEQAGHFSYYSYGNVIDNKPIEDDFGIINCSEGIDLMPCNVELSGIESYLFTVMSGECIKEQYHDFKDEQPKPIRTE